jgi:peptidoglycan/xylan/chitin deacetylase (PgdA/CDA1 family)
MNEYWIKLGESLRDASDGGRRIALFFRDDDAAEDIPPLRRLLSLFETQEMAINIEVIPGLLTTECAGLLGAAPSGQPKLIEVNQHGWRHENHETTGRKCEFGPARDYQQQLEDIRAGRARLDEMLGSAFYPVFTPPWNRYCDATCQALIDLGFHAISDLESNRTVNVNTALRRIPATLDIIDWRSSRDLKPVDLLLTELIRQIQQSGHRGQPEGANSPKSATIGILLHHRVMSEAAFSFIDRLLTELKGFECVVPHTFRSLLEGKHA